MGQKVHSKGFRLAFLKQNTFKDSGRMQVFQTHLNKPLFSFTNSSNKILYGKKVSQNILLTKLVSSYLSRVFCILNEIYIRETSLGIFVYVEFFEIKPAFSNKGEFFTKYIEKIQKHAECYLCEKKPLQFSFIEIGGHLSKKEKLELSEYKRRMGRISEGTEPLLRISFSSVSFPAAAGFARLFAYLFEKNFKHQQLLNSTAQLLALVFQIKSSTFLGLRLQVKGRIGGSDRSKKQVISFGSIPLQAVTECVNYGFAEAITPYGKCGIKVWFIYKKLLKYVV